MAASKSQARYLSNVPEDKVFWVSNGGVLRNLYDLSSALGSMSDDTFKHHVNKSKNDFKNWVTHVIGDKSLATEIAKIKSKNMLAKKVNLRLKKLSTLAKAK